MIILELIFRIIHTEEFRFRIMTMKKNKKRKY